MLLIPTLESQCDTPLYCRQHYVFRYICSFLCFWSSVHTVYLAETIKQYIFAIALGSLIMKCLCLVWCICLLFSLLWVSGLIVSNLWKISHYLSKFLFSTLYVLIFSLWDSASCAVGAFTDSQFVDAFLVYFSPCFIL